jgi:ribosomal protein S27E
MALLCEMTLEECIEYSNNVWKEIDEHKSTEHIQAIACPNCNNACIVDDRFKLQNIICDSCGDHSLIRCNTNPIGFSTFEVVNEENVNES